MTDPASDDAAAAKWMCEFCTYMNFRSSLKCTMCTSLKPLLNEDIFLLSPSQPHSPSTQSSNHNRQPKNTSLTICRSKTPSPQPQCVPLPITARAVASSPSRGEASGPQHAILPDWMCTNCSYLNNGEASLADDARPATAKCGQCGANQDAAVEGSAAKRRTSEDLHNDMNDQLKAMSLERMGECAPDVIGSDPDLRAAGRSVSRTSSPMGSASNLSGSRQNLEIAAATAAAARVSPVDTRGGGKWSCVHCTYENWPKSLRCSMCAQAKELPASNQHHQNQAAVADDHSQYNANHQIMSSPDREFDDNCASNYIIPQKQQPPARNNAHHNRYQSGGGCVGGGGGTLAIGDSAPSNNCDTMQERRMRQLRRQADWQWLHACMGVVDNDYGAVEAYLSCGGNPGRSLNATEVALLNRNSAYDVGHTLIHLAIRFHREEMLPMLLTQINGSGPGIKRVPSYVAPDLASDIRRHFANSLRSRKASFACHYVTEHATFALPAEIEELPITIQEQLHEELFDRDAQAQLECSPPALNWSLEITVRLGSRLMVLWNRSAGDCLLDSAMQATWGVFDRDNVLRRALSDSLHQCGHVFYTRWKEYEMAQAALLHFTLDDAQWDDDWSTLLALARQPGASLEQLHIFTLAHILRRPIVVYGVKYVKSFRGEDIGYARFEGLYLPLLWEQSFCSKSPIALGYTRGHFSALVPTEPYARIDAARVDSEDVLFLPLMDCEHKLLPIHFLTHTEMGREESIMRQWLDVCDTEGGLLVAQQKLQKRPLLVAQMLEEWLNHYRRIAQVVAAPFARRGRAQNHTGYSSDGDTDEE